ncbi:hypothetical protein [Massilia sp. PWRC2]|uniref:hypothetical protein n=1 Tax=Massilia sp. PWRC2 TaxID=2804626 RepID=UPI003CEDDCB3
MAQISSNTFAVAIKPVTFLAASFQLTSAVGGSALPFALGYAFRKGEVPATASVAGSIPALQVTGKNWWPDGSLKFATISGRADLTANVAKTIKLALGTSTSGTALTTADLRRTNITASIAAGSFGTVSWGGADWDTPFQSWISGPQMSSWVYRKAVGSDPHLTAWLEVRLFVGGAVEVLPWVENGYLNVANPTNKNAEYVFAMGGTERFRRTIDIPNHCRTVLIAGTNFSYWLGTDPQIIPAHDKSYLQSTRLVPAYSAVIPSNATIWASIPNTFAPFQQGNYSPEMGQGGYQVAIGLLPEWDVLYIATDDARAYAGVITNAFSAGRFGIHYRDETTQRPLRFSSYPNLVTNGGGSVGISNTGASTKNTYTPISQGTTPATWDSPHHPSIGFTAYLLTGRYYFMEEVQFSATVNFLKNTDFERKFSAGVFQSNVGANTTRGAGWAVRTLAQAACITPDDDLTLRAEFSNSIAANIDFYYTRYITQTSNPFGFIAPYSNYAAGSGIYAESMWMEDFFTASFGYTMDVASSIPSVTVARLNEFFAWKAQSVIGRLGGTSPSEFLYTSAGLYTMAIAPTETPDFTTGQGPWFKNWGEIYKATLGSSNPGVNGPLQGGNFPEASSYWGNLQPAIAYAVQNKVVGAAVAYDRMKSASNWSDFVNSSNQTPVWSIIPHK